MAMQFTEPVKFKGTSTKEGISKKTDKAYKITEASFFVPDLGLVKVPVEGLPKLPELDQIINLRLTVIQGGFNSLKLVYDEQAVYSPVKA